MCSDWQTSLNGGTLSFTENDGSADLPVVTPQNSLNNILRRTLQVQSVMQRLSQPIPPHTTTNVKSGTGAHILLGHTWSPGACLKGSYLSKGMLLLQLGVHSYEVYVIQKAHNDKN
jgi:hypothetical protein